MENNQKGLPNIDAIKRAQPIRVKNNTNKKLIVILSVLIAILLIANIAIVSLAFFTDKASSSASIEFGSIEIILEFPPLTFNKLVNVCINKTVVFLISHIDYHLSIGKSFSEQ